jgi:hypothetical protein
VVGALMLMLMIGVPQVLGFAISRLFRPAQLRPGVGPAAAALIFTIGWYLAWLIPTRAHEAAGQRICGAAGALLIVPLVVLVPVHVVLAGILQAMAAYADGRRRRPGSGEHAPSRVHR